MRYCILLLLIISCKKETNEQILNEMFEENNIHIVNLFPQQIPTEMVLGYFEVKFLKKYSFYPKYEVKNLNINKIRSFEEKSNRYSIVSSPIFSSDHKNCLLRVMEYADQEIIRDVIFLFSYNDGHWKIIYELEKYMF